MTENIGFCEGDYVQVVAPPEPWDGSGESSEDLKSYVGHVGVVVENSNIDGQFALVRFANWSIVEIGQRMIEWNCLKLISHPENPLPEACTEELVLRADPTQSEGK